MRGRLRRPTLLAVWALLTASGFGPAAELDWAQKMFSELEHDFGVVARGADVRHRIFIKNLYEETVTIHSVVSSCGCTNAKASQNSLRTGETAYIELVLDTVNHMREKSPNIDVTVSFDGIHQKQVRIPVHVYIRSDVVLQPGAADFGTVDAGSGAQQKLSIAYAGRDDWRIREVRTNRDFLQATVTEKHRSAGRVDYELIVNLAPTAPQGALREQILLLTDDATNPYVPVAATANIEPDILVATPDIDLGVLTPGVDKTVRVVVRGRKPFSIETVECESSLECFKIKLPSEPKVVHVLPLTITPPDQKGELRELFTMKIAGRPEPVTFRAAGRIE